MCKSNRRIFISGVLLYTHSLFYFFLGLSPSVNLKIPIWIEIILFLPQFGISIIGLLEGYNSINRIISFDTINLLNRIIASFSLGIIICYYTLFLKIASVIVLCTVIILSSTHPAVIITPPIVVGLAVENEEENEDITAIPIH